jgi:methylmalonyl-CoA/ethylmalonyl-CoA epimerase
MGLPLDRHSFHHIGMVVDDLGRASQHMKAIYGLHMRTFDPITFRCRYLGVDMAPVTQMALSLEGPPHLELLQSTPDTPWTMVPGVHHLAYTVDDLVAGVAALESNGLPLELGGVDGENFPVGATYHRDPYGPIIELLSSGLASSLALRLHAAPAEAPEQA